MGRMCTQASHVCRSVAPAGCAASACLGTVGLGAERIVETLGGSAPPMELHDARIPWR